MTLTDELVNANKARWELARILLDGHVTGDIEVLHIECIQAAERLKAEADRIRDEELIGERLMDIAGG
jgi:hypothetical protein